MFGENATSWQNHNKSYAEFAILFLYDTESCSGKNQQYKNDSGEPPSYNTVLIFMKS